MPYDYDPNYYDTQYNRPPYEQHQQPYGHHQYPHDHYGELTPYTPGYHNYGQYAPTMRPPDYVPRRPLHHPGSIRRCTNKFVYVWLLDGRNFWTWIPIVSRRTIYGYRWTGHRWVYFEADINDLETFVCI